MDTVAIVHFKPKHHPPIKLKLLYKISFAAEGVNFLFSQPLRGIYTSDFQEKITAMEQRIFVNY
jgi:hypothetical protein